jgi:DNA-directed RNA polymerase specialized sigma24 family protein
MTSGPTCRCLLCQIESQLLDEVRTSIPEYEAILTSTTNGLCRFRSPFQLLSHLKVTQADPASDDLYRELLAMRHTCPQLIEMLLILAFVSVLHRTVRRIAKHQSHLARTDIIQQALSVFLQVLRSEQVEGRQSHLVFAISRLLKRQLFEWASREGRVHGTANKETLQVLAQMADDQSMERHAQLGHFLHRCAASGLLSNAELDLLTQIKLDGNSGAEIADSISITSNAVRQRMKRLLHKLRRVAGTA